MKKTFFALLTSVLVLGACDNDNGTHYTEIYYPMMTSSLFAVPQHSSVLMADQTADSLVFTSTDSWTMLNSAPDWCSYEPQYANFVNKYTNTWVLFRMPLTFRVNTSGVLRTAVLKIRGEGDKSMNTAYFFQTPFLGITRPLRILNSDLIEEKMYPLSLSPEATTDSVTFRVYGDWTLTPLDGSWLTLAATEGKAGDNVVELSVLPNPSSEERADTLILISNGVTDSIPVLQSSTKIKIDDDGLTSQP